MRIEKTELIGEMLKLFDKNLGYKIDNKYIASIKTPSQHVVGF